MNPTDILSVITTNRRPARMINELFRTGFNRLPSVHLVWRLEHSLKELARLERNEDKACDIRKREVILFFEAFMQTESYVDAAICGN